MARKKGIDLDDQFEAFLKEVHKLVSGDNARYAKTPASNTPTLFKCCGERRLAVVKWSAVSGGEEHIRGPGMPSIMYLVLITDFI